MKMLGVRTFLQPCNSTTFTPFSPYLYTPTPSIPKTPNKTSSNSCSNVLFLQGRNGVLVSAAKKQKKASESLIDMDEFDVLDDEDDDEEEGVFIPLSGMSEWFDKKPSGFGEGKEYDTTLEDKLLEELEQSRKAQIANINNLKNNPLMGSSKKDQQVTKAPEAVPSGVRVRVGNLPKKKNILRDLKLVFKGFPAIVNISPAVSGTKKTRDPVCKGFAFVDLGSVEAANRFVQTYSKKKITFGKIEKQITCEIANPAKSSIPASSANYSYSPGQRLQRVDADSTADSVVDRIFLESTKGSPLDESGVQPNEIISTTSEAIDKGIAHINLSETDSNADSIVDHIALDSVEVSLLDASGFQHQETMSATSEAIEQGIADINLSEMNDFKSTSPALTNKTDSLPLKQEQKKQAPKKKQIVKGKLNKSSASKIPGSTKRLRIKEKALLAGAFSKYGSKASPSLTKER